MGTDISHVVRDSRDPERVFSFINWNSRYYSMFEALCGVRPSGQFLVETACTHWGFSEEVQSWISEDNNLKLIRKGETEWSDYWLGDHDHGHVKVSDLLPNRLTKLRRWPINQIDFREYVRSFRGQGYVSVPEDVRAFLRGRGWQRMVGVNAQDLDLLTDDQIKLMQVHEDYPSRIYALDHPVPWDPLMIDYFYESVLELEKDAEFVTIDFGFDS